MKPHLNVFLSGWHIRFSGAFHAVLNEPLKDYFDFDIHEWDCREVEQIFPEDSVLVFQQFPPPLSLLENPKKRIVWTPMGDTVAWMPKKFWENLPKHIRIVAFSNRVERIARHFNFPTLRLKYYKNPQDHSPVDWSGTRRMFYWNRRGLFKPDLLELLCNRLQVEEFFFKSDVDPDASAEAGYTLPDRLGKTRVVEIARGNNLSQYMDALRCSQVYLAPRDNEGIGMSFLEAMASGCAVLAFDGNTMDEYIQQRKTGFLLRPAIPRLLRNPRRRWFKRLKYLIRRQYHTLCHPSMLWFYYPFGEWQPYPMDKYTDLSCLEGCDLEAIGYAARKSQEEGYEHWMESLPQYVKFLSEW